MWASGIVTLAGKGLWEGDGSAEMGTASVKDEARKLIEKLPENTTWDDLMREIYVRQAIESGLADSQAGRTTDVAEVRAKFGLPK